MKEVLQEGCCFEEAVHSEVIDLDGVILSSTLTSLQDMPFHNIISVLILKMLSRLY